jgi:hypothetical protein
MPWTWFDDGYPEDKKLLAAGPLAMSLDMAAICFCSRELTDGFVPREKVPLLINLRGISINGRPATHEVLVRRLLRVRRWETAKGGYQIHDFLEYQPSRRQVEERRRGVREARSRAGVTSGEQRRNTCGTNAEQTRNQRGTPLPLPIPT